MVPKMYSGIFKKTGIMGSMKLNDVILILEELRSEMGGDTRVKVLDGDTGAYGAVTRVKRTEDRVGRSGEETGEEIVLIGYVFHW